MHREMRERDGFACWVLNDNLLGQGDDEAGVGFAADFKLGPAVQAAQVLGAEGGFLAGGRVDGDTAAQEGIGTQAAKLQRLQSAQAEWFQFGIPGVGRARQEEGIRLLLGPYRPISQDQKKSY